MYATLKMLWRSTIYSLTFLIVCLLIIVGHLEANLPNVNKLKDVQLQVPLKIYTIDGKLIAEFGDKRRTPIALNEVPQQLINAIVATEDRRFYSHPGVDLKGLVRAGANLISKGRKEQGGSTITMQVARNFFLSRNKTYMRKLNEILLALKIEQNLSKNEILELYMNKIFLGKGAYGVAAAAEVYYGKQVQELTLAQIAMIAGLPKAPTAINPLNSPEKALKRRTLVLENLFEGNYITFEEFLQAKDSPLSAKFHGKQIELQAPYVAEMVRQKLVTNFGEKIYEQGYEVVTTIDSVAQNAANQAIFRSLLEYDQRHKYRGKISQIKIDTQALANINDETKLTELIHQQWLQQLQDIAQTDEIISAAITKVEENTISVLTKNDEEAILAPVKTKWLGDDIDTAEDFFKIKDIIYVNKIKNNYHLVQIPQVQGAFVSIETNSGGILSLVGGFDFHLSRFNRATQAERQPGSAFKPFIYAAALEHGYTAASIINDAPIVQSDPSAEADWRPKNHTHTFNGPTRLRTALTQSRNLVSIRLLRELGVISTIELLKNMGFRANTLPNSLSLALGSNHVTPIELASAFCLFPNGGYRVDPFIIKEIYSYQGDKIYSAQPKLAGIDATQVISNQTSYIITSMLQDVVQKGTARLAHKLARKDIAGKTGTTNEQFDGWYAGFNRDITAVGWVGFDDPQTLKEYAVKTTLPMWVYFMEKTLKDKTENSPMQPEGLTTVRIDPNTGFLAHEEQENAIFEIFTDETVPDKIAPNYNKISAIEEIESIF